MKTDPKPTGLRYWMLRVLEECDKVSADFSADPVHDLRVALRRCRSMADGMIAMDPDHDWKAMKKAGKQLFQRLGELRDVQIMMEWIEKLKLDGLDAPLGSGTGETGDAGEGVHATASEALLHILKSREADVKHEARAALEEFDRKEWRQWSKSLAQRAGRIRPGSVVYKHLALERWAAARELHTKALRNRSQVAFHTLRIGIKRFRYIVENFLPEEHKVWGDDLKHLQDLLGEVHDFDVLWRTALSCRVFPDETSRQTWHWRILEERAKRIEEYRLRTTGDESRWTVWRAGLPQGKQIQEIATRRMKLWAKALDPDFEHAERVARLALELYDGLVAAGLLKIESEYASGSRNGAAEHARASLYVAALLHDVGKSKGNKGHHKESVELIKKHGTPMGWEPETMMRAAVVARFHCGALPTRSHKALRDLFPEEQKKIIRLAAVLRLANALDFAHDGHIRRVKVENALLAANGRKHDDFRPSRRVLEKNEALVIAAEGYGVGTATAQAVAAERYLLETVLKRPVLVRPFRQPASDIRRSAR